MCPKNGGQYIGNYRVSTAWSIHGVYVEYSWGIHGVYVCIGYVSGMYRVCVGNVWKQIRKIWEVLAYLRVLYYLCRKL